MSIFAINLNPDRLYWQFEYVFFSFDFTTALVGFATTKLDLETAKANRNMSTRVQAENKKKTGTFWHRIDPKNDLAAIFLTLGTIFAYHQGLLAHLHKKWDKTTIAR